MDGSVSRTVAAPGTRFVACLAALGDRVDPRVEAMGHPRDHGRVLDEEREATDGQQTSVVIDHLLDQGQDRLDVVVADGADGRLARIQRDGAAALDTGADTVPGGGRVAG